MLNRPINHISVSFQAHAPFDIIHNINVTPVSQELALQVCESTTCLIISYSDQELISIYNLNGNIC